MSAINQISDMAMQHMAAWYSRRPSFALMGEFSSGKSTLLNLLIGKPMLPTKVTVTKLPVIWMTYGTVPACHGLSRDGKLDELDSAQPDADIWDQYLLVRLTLDAPMLKHCDVIDTPGISDPRLAAGSLKFIAEYIDFAIWCTAANQAWRQSEKAAWKALPKALRENSILAITRTDQLTASNDLKKVLKRMDSETSGMFGGICPIATRRAMAAANGGKVIEPTEWRASGAEALLSAIKSSMTAAQHACGARETVAALTEIRTGEAVEYGGQSAASTTAQPAIANLISKGLLADISTIFSQARGQAAKNTVSATIGQVRNALLSELDRNDAHAEVLATCLSVNDLDSLDNARLLDQVEQEFEDFAEGAWCCLAEERREKTHN